MSLPILVVAAQPARDMTTRSWSLQDPTQLPQGKQLEALARSALVHT
jgi:hypothetical protein